MRRLLEAFGLVLAVAIGIQVAAPVVKNAVPALAVLCSLLVIGAWLFDGKGPHR